MGREIERTSDADRTLERINALFKRVEGGDARAAEQLRPLLDATPGTWECIGDLAGHAQRAWLELASGDNGVTQEAITRTSGRMRADLLGPSPTPLERLLVERIVACWLQVYYLESLYAQRLKEGGPMTWSGDDGHQRRQDRAHRRYLAAIRSLAQVRRLVTPMVQVNIAERQVNVSQGAGLPAGRGRRPRRSSGNPGELPRPEGGP